MIDYASILNTSGAFPLVTGDNSTGPGNLDGTPYIRSVIDDLWGFSQALMDAASLTPDAVTESATASQRLEAIRRIAGYPGETVHWQGDDADPSVLGIRLLPLNGQGVLVATYPELDASCYVGNILNPTASKYYRADDAAGTIRNTTGIYLILPDCRGAFLRGLDTSGVIDPDGASRDIGSNQDWAVFDHRHNVRHSLGVFNVYFSTITLGGSEEMLDASGSPGDIGQAWAQTMYDAAGAAIPSANVNINESRPVNIAGRWCIRY